jgi:hypothetical protein
MDEQSERIYEAYTKWRRIRDDLDIKMRELSQGLISLEEVEVVIEGMREAWRNFEAQWEGRLRR